MLFVVDMQNDFVDENRGTMAVPGAREIVDGILLKIKEAERNHRTIVYTLNDHYDQEEDTRSQVEKDWGHELFGPLMEALQGHIPVTKGYYAVMPKKLLEALKKAGKEKETFDTIELVGVDTAVYVLSNAVVLRNLFPEAKIVVHSSLTRSADGELGVKALEVMKGISMEIRE